MKKVFVLFCTLLVLASCNIENLNVESIQEENQEIKVNITISRSDIVSDTKAAVKSGWADGDVVFVFFKGIAAPKYLEMKYIATGGTWTSTAMNGLTSSDLSGAADKKMTAVYLPYGSDYTVADSDDNFTLKNAAGEDYCGHFYYCEPQSYTISESTLSGNISLSVARPVTEDDVLVHFDVTNPVAGSEYLMYQDYMKPMSLATISASGIITKSVGALGEAIPGYKDASFVSFSGVLDKNYKGNNSYWFSIRDTELGTLYYRDAGSHAISANKYIGLGKLTGDGKSWSVATPGAFSIASGKHANIASSNLSYLGATGGENPWRLMKYPWSVISFTEKVANVVPTSSDDFGYFGWGTSGWPNTGEGSSGVANWTFYMPWSWRNEYILKYPTDYGGNPGPEGINRYKFGPDYDAENKYGLTGIYANGDWGIYNDIYSYGGDVKYNAGYWRTPSQAEWEYIINTRGGDRCAKGTINDMHGLIILPDGFSAASYGINHVNENADSYGYNTLSDCQWNKIEAAGAVFLPAAGNRGMYGSNMVERNYYTYCGIYWSSTVIDANKAYDLFFNCGWTFGKDSAHLYTTDDVSRCAGLTVRFIHPTD